MNNDYDKHMELGMGICAVMLVPLAVFAIIAIPVFIMGAAMLLYVAVVTGAFVPLLFLGLILFSIYIAKRGPLEKKLSDKENDNG